MNKLKIAQVINADSWGSIGPEALERGIGGREGALIRLAKEWASLNHEVTNFVATNRADRFYEKGGFHEYIPLSLAKPMLQSFPYDAVVAWECPSIFGNDFILEKQKVRLVHMQVAHFNEGELEAAHEYATGIVSLSKWAQNFSHHEGLRHENLYVRPNGVDIGNYPLKSIQNKPNGYRFVYSSSPDRGLVHLLRMWPLIRKRYRKANLFVTYGVKNFVDQMKWAHYKIGEDCVDIIEGMKQPGVIDLGKIGQKELAELQCNSSAWIYPADTIQATETGCLVKGSPVDCPRDYSVHPDGIPIEEIVPGQLVWTINEKTHKFELKRVLKAWMTRKLAEVFQVTLDDGKTIKGTPEHPFMMRDGSWKELKDLSPGDSLMPLYKDFEPRVMIDPDIGSYVREYESVGDQIGNRSGKHIHHKDVRHGNTSEENLCLLDPSDHHRLHNAKDKGFRKWWDRLTEEELEIQRESKRRAAEMRWGKTPRPDGTIRRTEHKEAILNHKVVSVVRLAEKEDVYNLEVQDNHNYVVNGVVVHNCITAIENMAAGNPCFMTNADCLEEEFSKVSTVIPLPFSSEKFVDKIWEILEETPQQRQWLIERGREFAERRDWSAIAPTWIDLFKENADAS